jgi:signal transduction histidine kinase
MEVVCLDLLSGNIPKTFIYFIYGLVFFTMGISVLVHCRQFSEFKLSKPLQWLGLFGVTHAFAEWTHMFNVILFGFKMSTFIGELRALEAVLTIISFLFLMVFSTRVFISFPEKRYLIRYLHPLIVFSWILSLFLFTKTTEFNNMVPIIIVITRYFICFPCSLLAAYSFLLQARNLNESDYKNLRKYLFGVTLGFALYAVFAGLIVREQEYSLSKYLTYTFIEDTTGIPVPLYRAFIATWIAYFMMQSMRLFNLEYSLRLAQAEKENTIMQERERISGDLHDGTIQTLYGITLLLENTQANLQDENSKEQINYALTYLNDSIQELRLFITHLRTPALLFTPFAELISSRVGLFAQAKSGLTLTTESTSLTKLHWLSPDEKYHVLCITQEVLANILKHSNATAIKVYCIEELSYAILCIEDNGQAIDSERIHSYNGSGLGLRNITVRARNLGAEWSWFKNPKNDGNIFRLSLVKQKKDGKLHANQSAYSG